MRSVLVLPVAVLVLAGCNKASTTTAPIIADNLSVAGTWTGCLKEPLVPCSAVTMTLTDSSLTDSSAAVLGTGNWGASVAIHGKLVDTNVNLDASAVGVLQGWSFAGNLSGNSITGNMSVPGNDSTFQATFTKSP